MIHVINKIERVSKSLIDQFREIGSATVHEAYGRKGAVDRAIKPIARGVRICGPAFTVQCHPGDNLMLHKALERAQPGDIIVASVGNYPEAGYWGGLMATSAVAKKLGGWRLTVAYAIPKRSLKWDFPYSVGDFVSLERPKPFSGSSIIRSFLEGSSSIPEI